MNKVYMVRHGEAASGWGESRDPDLSDKGREQAQTVAKEIAKLLPQSVPIFSSPLLRCQSTAQPLADLWNSKINIEPRVAEIPSPTDDLSARSDWLRRVMGGTWGEFYADPDTAQHIATYKEWQAGVVAALCAHAAASDIVVFSHFIALNVAAASAIGATASTQFTTFRPDNASLTIFAADGDRLALVQQGREAQTRVN